MLGGSWVVIRGVVSPLTNMGYKHMVPLLTPPLITTHEPPGRGLGV